MRVCLILNNYSFRFRHFVNAYFLCIFSFLFLQCVVKRIKKTGQCNLDEEEIEEILEVFSPNVILS